VGFKWAFLSENVLNEWLVAGMSLALITGMNTENNWSKPELEEIPLSCEVTSYSNAELPEENPIL
jgi:coenzyme PQQ precursor peptide PqqA